MMKQIYLTTLFALTCTISALAVHSPVTVENAEASLYGVAFDANMLTVDDIIQYKPKELARKHGVRLKFKQRVALSVVRGKLKRAKRKGLDLQAAYDDAAGGSNFHVGGFLLGLFLGLLGWLLAILIWPRLGAGRSALLGWAVWLIVLLLLVV